MDSQDLPGEIPIHTPCGLPAELCTCPDAPFRFEDGRFVAQPPLRPGEIFVSLESPGSEERARKLIADGMEVLEVTVETAEIECPVCGWGADSLFQFSIPVGVRPLSRTMDCLACGFAIELSPELHGLLSDLTNRPLKQHQQGEEDA